MRPFWQELILNIVGPLTAAAIGTFLLGLAAAYVTRRWQEHKEDAELRESLIRELLEAATALYLGLRQYEFLADHPEPFQDMPAEQRNLEAIYVRTRTAGDAIGPRLFAQFDSEDLAQNWHSMMDLLTTRYFQLVGAPPDSYLGKMEGAEHTTLSSAELASPERIFERYKHLAQLLPVMILEARRRTYRNRPRTVAGRKRSTSA
jgi:hypothetical protein